MHLAWLRIAEQLFPARSLVPQPGDTRKDQTARGCSSKKVTPARPGCEPAAGATALLHPQPSFGTASRPSLLPSSCVALLRSVAMLHASRNSASRLASSSATAWLWTRLRASCAAARCSLTLRVYQHARDQRETRSVLLGMLQAHLGLAAS